MNHFRRPYFYHGIAIVVVSTTTSLLCFPFLFALFFFLLFLACGCCFFFSFLFRLFFGTERCLDFILLVKAVHFVWILSKLAVVVHVPVSALVSHAVRYALSFYFFDFLFQFPLFLLEGVMVVRLNIFAEGLSLLVLHCWINFLFFFSFGLAPHTKENHFCIAHLFYGFSGKQATNAVLDYCSTLLFYFMLIKLT